MEDKKYPGQICQDEITNNLFREFHKRLVNEIISFCNLNNIDIDEFILRADGVASSLEFKSWEPCTDSCFELYKCDKRFDKEPYLISI